jgi:hypothetical protein
MAAVAIQKRLAPLYRHHGQEKEAEVMIHPLQDGLMQPASRAALPRRIEDSGLGLNAPNEKKHNLGSILFQGFRKWLNSCAGAAISIQPIRIVI